MASRHRNANEEHCHNRKLPESFHVDQLERAYYHVKYKRRAARYASANEECNDDGESWWRWWRRKRKNDHHLRSHLEKQNSGHGEDDEDTIVSIGRLFVDTAWRPLLVTFCFSLLRQVCELRVK